MLLLTVMLMGQGFAPNLDALPRVIIGFASIIIAGVLAYFVLKAIVPRRYW